MSTRRIALLVDVARFVIMLERLEPGRPSPAITAKVLAAFWQRVRDTANAVFPPDQADRFMTACAKQLEWSDVAMIDDMFAGQDGRELVSVMREAMTGAEGR
jgi:hypothetical protein